MTEYQQAMESNPARLVIGYIKGDTVDKDEYPWGVSGSMPVTQLIGYITRVQAELAFRNPDPCDDVACVIIYRNGKMQWFVNNTIPVDPLVGALELVKAMLVGNQIAQVMQAVQRKAQTGLIDPTGKPILKGL